jgi:hypothetical protein
MIIDVNDAQSQRFHLGLSCLQEGGGLRLGRVEFVITENRNLECRIITQWSIDSLNDELAYAEFEFGKAIFNELQAISVDFNQIAHRFDVRYSIISDYGSGAVAVCRLEEHEIIWSIR